MVAGATRSGAGDVTGGVGAVIVNYNAKAHLLMCVQSLLAEGVAQVVVADNNSTDGSEMALLERFPAVRWAPTGGNVGYGAAANKGARKLVADYLLVCNPDVSLGKGAAAAMARVLDARPEVGVVGPCVIGSDGRVYPSARRFPDLLEAFGHGFVGQVWPGNPFSRRYRMTDRDHACGRDVDWVSGSCFMVRRQAWDAVGGFDPRYFMYLEDVDLCWRLRKAGWAVAYEPAARVVHIQGVSTDRHPYRMLVAHHVSMWRFARRTTTGPRRALLVLVLPGLGARLVITWARRALSGLWRSTASGRGPRPGRPAPGRGAPSRSSAGPRPTPPPPDK